MTWTPSYQFSRLGKKCNAWAIETAVYLISFSERGARPLRNLLIALVTFYRELVDGDRRVCDGGSSFVVERGLALQCLMDGLKLSQCYTSGANSTFRLTPYIWHGQPSFLLTMCIVQTYAHGVCRWRGPRCLKVCVCVHSLHKENHGREQNWFLQLSCYLLSVCHTTQHVRACVHMAVGGTLKALTPTDVESLQAKWFDLDTIKSSLQLRYLHLLLWVVSLYL